MDWNFLDAAVVLCDFCQVSWKNSITLTGKQLVMEWRIDGTIDFVADERSLLPGLEICMRTEL